MRRDYTKTSLPLLAPGINVTVTSRENPQRTGLNYFSSLLPLAYDIEDNPLFKALKAKAEQLAGVPSSALKVVFVADSGSRLLRHLTEKNRLGQYKFGMKITRHFPQKRDVDLVCIFPRFRQLWGFSQLPPDKLESFIP